MSAGSEGSLKPSKDLNLLAPKFKAAIEAAIAECDTGGFNAIVFEAYRSDQLQKLYYARGRTIIPPTHTVTNAPNNQYSWHGYGLAVDVIHKEKFWNPPEGEGWFRNVAAVFKKHGCNWGGDWKHPDTPHFQWGKCKPSPSDEARKLLATGGIQAVWEAVDAN